jgi:addiction module RelE/StbE family toxin
MRKLIWGKTFIKAYKRTLRKHQTLNLDTKEIFRLLTTNPFSPQLETHKLKGKLSGSWACTAGYNLRIVFDFVKNNDGNEDDILLLEIGTHDEVY